MDFNHAGATYSFPPAIAIFEPFGYSPGNAIDASIYRQHCIKQSYLITELAGM